MSTERFMLTDDCGDSLVLRADGGIDYWQLYLTKGCSEVSVPSKQLADWCREVLKRIDPAGEYEGKVAADVEETLLIDPKIRHFKRGENGEAIPVEDDVVPTKELLRALSYRTPRERGADYADKVRAQDVEDRLRHLESIAGVAKIEVT